ncbi:conserved protein of unknown function [Cupriavidus taiwanensis]|uniref:Uncharacterized protein n=1 Tax=Cupriavidus taiwanensis TaxID=164546 RepID=A0A7Z7NKE9_9BURK|nr:hypothetical protein CBM2595_A30537 [Cupriavidus taiwanensis]SPC09208.1 hypothetical protein CBM2594_A40531 [Cupriavidus taiwanensis]SPD39002.1 conserved protein of unknown function [Cupriavidus taiwanensis]
MGGLDDGVQHGVELVLGHHHFDLDLGQEVDHVLGAAVQLGMPFLAAKSLYFGHRQPGHADISQGFTHLVELERFDDGGNLLHDWPLFIVCSRAWRRIAADAALSGGHFNSPWALAFLPAAHAARRLRGLARIRSRPRLWITLGTSTGEPVHNAALQHHVRRPRRSIRHLLQVREPHHRLRVAGRTPVAAWRQRAARPHLGRIRHARALELAGAEEAVQEDRQVALDVGQAVLVACHVRAVGPDAALAVAPGVQCQEGDLGRGKAKAQRVVEVEVLQLVRADGAFGLLLGAVVAVAGDQLGTDVGVEHRQQHVRTARADLPGLGDPAHQVRDQRLRHARVDVVVRHVVAHAIRAPAQRQLAQVAGADHDGMVVVGQPEQVVGALARLHVLEGHVVDLFAGGIRVAQVLQHRQARWPDIDLGGGAADHLHQLARLLQRAAAGGKAGHGVRQDIGARQAQPVHRLGADQQRVGGIEPARDADHHLADLARRQPLHQGLHLDVVDLHAAFVALARIGRHVREARHVALQRQRLFQRQVEREAHDAELVHLGLVPPHRVAEGHLVHALAREPLDVDIGEQQVRGVGKALGLGQQLAVLADQRLAVPGQVGGRLALAGRGVQVGRQAARRLLRHQLVPVARLADHDIRCRQVDQHRSPGQRRERRRRDRHPYVLADFGVEAEVGDVLDVEQQAGAERHLLAQQLDRIDRGVVGGAELARLVELPVVGQVGLGHHALDAPARHHHGAVEQLVLDPQRHAHHQRHRQLARGFDDGRQRRLAGIQQRALVEQVVAGIGRQPQFRERDQHGAALRRLRRQGNGLVGVEGRVGDAADRHAHRDARKAVRIQVEKQVFHIGPWYWESCGGPWDQPQACGSPGASMDAWESTIDQDAPFYDAGPLPAACHPGAGFPVDSTGPQRELVQCSLNHACPGKASRHGKRAAKRAMPLRSTVPRSSPTWARSMPRPGTPWWAATPTPRRSSGTPSCTRCTSAAAPAPRPDGIRAT